MKKILTSILTLTALAGSPQLVFAEQTQQTPALIIYTNLGQMEGENDLVIQMGMTSPDYVDIDGGFGSVEFPVGMATFDSESGAIQASVVTTRVSSAGVVKIYGDASKIDYLDVNGGYITRIEMPSLTNLEILNLEHNELQGLDLTGFNKLQYVILNDNPFSVSPLKIGPNKPDLALLSLDIINNMSADFNLSDYPSMVSFSAWSNRALQTIDPSGCPLLRQLSIDSTDVAYLDVTHNPELQVLNISDTRIRTIDLSKNQKLIEFYCQHQSGTINPDIKMTELDLSHNPELYYLFASGNALTSIDLSHNPKLFDLGISHNQLTTLNLTANANLYNVDYSYNYMDFATMPRNPGTWGNLVAEQYPMQVDLSYPVGGVLDLASRVLLPGYTTTVQLFRQNSLDPNDVTLLTDEDYSYADGKVTFLKESNDSIYVKYFNSAFDNVSLSTTKFMVKSAADYGKPTNVLEFSGSFYPGNSVAFRLGVEGATEQTPKTIYVDLGDGSSTPFTITTSNLPSSPNVTANPKGYGSIRVLVDDNIYISAFGINAPLYTCDVSRSRALRHLDLSHAGLYNINLQNNQYLSTLDVSYNNLSQLDLTGVTPAFNKTALTQIDASHNQISTFTVPDNRVLVNLDLSYNAMTEFLFRDADNIESLNLEGNQFEELSLTYCSKLKNLNAANNNLTSVVLAEDIQPQSVQLQNNKLTFATLPVPSSLGTASYTYQPQSMIEAPVIGPGLNLRDLYLDINGNVTQFVWYKADGSRCTESVDYSIDEGSTHFINTTMGKVYCEITNGAFPALTLRTTEIEAAGEPTVKIASFKTPKGGEDVKLSLAALNEGTAVYFDWTGKKDYDQYMLGTTYRLFDAKTSQGANVGVYTYKTTDKVSVFSITGATMSDVDITSLTDATTITLDDAGISEIALPESTNLVELSLANNNLSAIDLSGHTNLRLLSLDGNKFTNFDLSPFKSLQLASLSNNNLTSVNLDNSSLWMFAANSNKLESIDLSKVKSLEQLALSDNLLTSIDVSSQLRLVVLDITRNKFNFATLPLPKSTWYSYTYDNQQELRPTVSGDQVDLSFTKEAADGTPTEYRWYLGTPQVSSEGVIEGEELYIDDEYTLDEGVTTFLGHFPSVVCAMTNPRFPRLILLTAPIDMSSISEAISEDDITVDVANGTVTITCDKQIPVALYTLNGQLSGQTTVNTQAQFANLQPGIYILVTPAGPYKLIVR